MTVMPRTTLLTRRVDMSPSVRVETLASATRSNNPLTTAKEVEDFFTLTDTPIWLVDYLNLCESNVRRFQHFKHWLPDLGTTRSQMSLRLLRERHPER
jgi:hypothetical protein